MLLVTVTVSVLIVVTIVYLILSILRFSKKIAEHGNVDILSLVHHFAESLYALALLVPLQLLAQAYQFASHVATNWKYYLVVGAFSIAIVGWSEYNHEFISITNTVDKAAVRPALRIVIWPLLNVIRIVYDILICWWNAYFYIISSSLSITGSIIAHCEAANFQNQASKALVMIEAPFSSAANFMISKGEQDLDVDSVVFATGDFLHSFQPVFDCICEDLSFATDIALDSVDSRNLSRAIDRWFNTVWIIGPRTFVNGAIDLFQRHTLDPPNCKGIQCKLQRAPKFDQWSQAACDAFYYSGQWIDEVVQIIYDTFFGNTDVQMPPLGKLLSGPPCAVAQAIGVAADIGFHVDLVFDGTNYLHRANITSPQDALLNVSQGLEDFFKVFRTGPTDDIGGSLKYGTRVIIRAYNFTVLVLRELATDPSNVASFVKSYSHNEFNTEWDKFVNYTVHPIKDVNVPAGQTLEYLLKSVQRLAILAVETIGNIGDLYTFMARHFPQDFEGVLSDVDSYAVALGNFVRQFSGSDKCPIYDPANPTIAREKLRNSIGKGERSFFCCAGNSIEGLVHTLVDVLDVAFDTAIDVVFNNKDISTIIKDLYEKVRKGIAVDYEVTIDAFGCTTASPIISKCRSGGGSNVGVLYRDSIGLLVSSGFNITSIPLRFLVVGLEQINNLQEGLNPTKIDHIVCDMILMMYDFTWGNLANLARRISQVAGCVFGDRNTDFGGFGNKLWNTFGWDNHSSGNIRTIICKLSSALIKFIVGMINVITKIQGLIFEIIAWFKCAFDQLKELKQAFSDTVFCIRLDIDFKNFDFDLKAGASACNGPGLIVKFPEVFASLANGISTMFQIVANIFGGKCTAVAISASSRSVPYFQPVSSRNSFLLQQSNVEEYRYRSKKGSTTATAVTTDWSLSVNLKSILESSERCKNLRDSYFNSGEFVDENNNNNNNSSNMTLWERELIEKELWQCAGSQLLSRVINYKLSQWAGLNVNATTLDIFIYNNNNNNNNETSQFVHLIDGDTFYDVRAGMNTTVKLIQTASPILSFLFMDTYNNMTWNQFVQYASSHGHPLEKYSLMFGNHWADAMNKFKFDKGVIFQGMVSAFDGLEDIASYYEDSVFVASTLKKFGWDVWMEKGGLLESLTNPPPESTKKRAMEEVNARKVTPNPRRRRNNPLSHAQSVAPGLSEVDDDDDGSVQWNMNHPIVPVYRKAVQKFENLRTNLTMWWNRVTRVSPKAQKNRDSIAAFWEYASYSYYAATNKGKMKYKVNYDYESYFSRDSHFPKHIVPTTSPSSSLSSTNTEVCVPGTNQCLNCALAKRLLNNAVNVICDCIAWAKQGIDINSTHIHPGQPKDANSSAPIPTDLVHPSGMSGAILAVYEFILGGVVDMNQTSSRFASFLVKGSGSTPNDFNWFGILYPCQYSTLDCATNSHPGFGLGWGILFALAFLVGFTVVAITIFSPLQPFVSTLWLAFVPIVLFFAYNWSIRCYLAIPRCLADDAYILATSFNPNCTEWEKFLPGLVKTKDQYGCATSFYDCAEEPYNMDRSERTFFTLMEIVYPPFNEFLRNTKASALSWIREVWEKDLTFDFPSGQVPEVYRSCMYANSGNLLIVSFFGVTTTVISCLIAFMAITIYVCVLRLMALGIAFSMFWVVFYFGGKYDNKQDRANALQSELQKKKEQKALIIKLKKSERPSLNMSMIMKLIKDNKHLLNKNLLTIDEGGNSSILMSRIQNAEIKKIKLVKDLVSLCKHYVDVKPKSQSRTASPPSKGNKMKRS